MAQNTDRPNPDAGRIATLYDDLAGRVAGLPADRQVLMYRELLEMGLAEDLREAIRESGLTHYSIGKMAGVAPAVIDRFVSGERDIRMETASKIAEALRLRLCQDKRSNRRD